MFNYILSVLFVYEDKGNSKSVKGAILFAVLSVIGMLINMGGMWLGYDVCGINEWVTKIIMTHPKSTWLLASIPQEILVLCFFFYSIAENRNGKF